MVNNQSVETDLNVRYYPHYAGIIMSQESMKGILPCMFILKLILLKLFLGMIFSLYAKCV